MVSLRSRLAAGRHPTERAHQSSARSAALAGFALPTTSKFTPVARVILTGAAASRLEKNEENATPSRPPGPDRSRLANGAFWLESTSRRSIQFETHVASAVCRISAMVSPETDF